jgi:pilus assembly protein CpaE
VSYKVGIESFVMTPASRAVIEEIKGDRRLLRSEVAVHDGNLETAFAYFSQNHTPDLIIVEENGNDAALMDGLEKLAEVCAPNTRVIVIGTLNDIRLYRTLLQSGVSEYLVQPVTSKSIIDAIDAIYADPSRQTRARLVAFYGAKGGTGSSTVAHNTAWTIAQMGNQDVTVIDTDLAFGTAALAFNLEPKQTLADALSNPERLDASLIERFLVKYDNKLSLFASPATLRAFSHIETEALDKVLELSRSASDFLIIDMPHVWTPWVQQVLIEADEVVVTATPELACLRDAKSLNDFLSDKRGEDGKLKFVLNHVDPSKKTQLTAKDFQETIGIEPLQVLPSDTALFGQAANNGQMIGEVNKTHKAVEQFRQIAIAIGAHAPVQRSKNKGLGLPFDLGWLENLFKKKDGG